MIGRFPFLQAKNRAWYFSYCGIQLQFVWCHSFWSLFLLAVIYFCVSVFIFVSRVNLCCVPGRSVRVRACSIRLNISKLLLPPLPGVLQYRE